jgi:hypothetical protein
MGLARVKATHIRSCSRRRTRSFRLFMAAQLKYYDGVNVQVMLDNDIVESSTGTAVDGTIGKFDLRMFVRGIPTIENSSEISELTAIRAENDSPAHRFDRFV